MEAQIPQVIFPGIEAELSKYCPNCGTEVHLPEMPQAETESFGVAKTIESILLEEKYKLNSLVLSCTGQDIVLSCMMHTWI